jgi:hypothetical protein
MTNVTVECLAHLLHVMDVPGSNLSTKAGYPDWVSLDVLDLSIKLLV